MPMEKALHPGPLLALKMNGESPAIHGFPARLVVPGWDGISWVKWVIRLTPAAKESGGVFIEPGLSLPQVPSAARHSRAPGGVGSHRRHAGKIHSDRAGRSEQGAAGRDGDPRFRVGGRERRGAGRGLDRWRGALARRAAVGTETALRLAP